MHKIILFRLAFLSLIYFVFSVPGDTDECDSANSQLKEGMIAYWKMDESAWSEPGAVKDSSGKGNHGTASGAVITTKAKFGNGALFTNNKHFISLNTPLDNTDISFSLWYYYEGPNPGMQWNVLLSCSNSNNAFHLAVDRSGAVGEWFRGGNPVLSGVYLIPGNWYHLVKVIQGKRHTLYVNGTVEQEFIGFSNSKFPFDTIGNQKDYTYGALGVIDEVGVWNKPLSEAEVVALYNSKGN